MLTTLATLRSKEERFLWNFGQKVPYLTCSEKWQISDFRKSTLFDSFSQNLRSALFGVFSVVRKKYLSTVPKALFVQAELQYSEMHFDTSVADYGFRDILDYEKKYTTVDVP